MRARRTDQLAEIELARVLGTLGRLDEAISHARAALELFEAKRDRPRAHTARALIEGLATP